MATKPRPTRVVLAPKKAGKVPLAAIRRAVDKVAVEVWQEKLSSLEDQEASTADAARRSALKRQIEEVKAKLDQFGG